ncbi:MAG: M50 family metallopeptidase [Candidatus Odinarchaeota archaeon]
MYFYWAIVAPILPALAIFLSPILIKEKKRVAFVFLGANCILNVNIILNIINTFRRDFNADLSIFPLTTYVSYLIITNIVFLSSSLILLVKLDTFKQNRFIYGIQSFFYKIKDKLFKFEKITDKILSVFLLVCLFYIIGFLNLYVHEFGHAIADILVGGYYREIRINLYLQGWTSGGGLPTDIFTPLRSTVISLGGLIVESIFAVFSLLIILRKKEKSSFTWLLAIGFSILFLNRVMLYFTFPVLLNISSDVLSLANMGFDPWILFFIFLPFLIITFAFTFILIARLYKTSLHRNRTFIYILFLGLTTYIVILNILKAFNDFGTPLIFLSFY